MIRYFLVLAVTGDSLLVANFVLGLFAAGEVRGPHAVWHGVHLLFSLLTVVVLLGIHSIVYTYFMATGKWAKEVVRVYQLPEWFVTQATRNKRRAFRFIMGSMTAIAVTAWLGRRLTPGVGLRPLAPGRRRLDARLQLRLVRRGICRDRGPCPAAPGVEVPGRRTPRGPLRRRECDRVARSRRDPRRRSAAPLPGFFGGLHRRCRRSGSSILIVLIDLLGFTVVMPLLAPSPSSTASREWQIGLLFSAYPFCQLIAGPILGRLSDRYGRRPLLIFSQAGTAISFLILGLSRNFTVMLLARMLDGASGGNILVAQAYVADVTPPENRARAWG